MAMNKDFKESVWLNHMRAIATVAVIVLHVSSVCVIQESALVLVDHSSINWHIGNIIDSLVRFCVPVFVMISGALLLPKEISLHDFLRKRLKRILLPFIFWSLVYAAVYLFYKNDYHDFATFSGVARFYFRSFIQGASYHLWYIYMIFGLYLIAPIISSWVVRATKSELLFLLFLWLASMALNQAGLHTAINEFVLVYFTGYLGYFILGFYIAYRLPITRLIIISAIIMFSAGFIITCLGTYLSTLHKGSLSSQWYEYLTLNIVLMAAGIFILGKALQQVKLKAFLRNILNIIGKYSFGIYLVHVLILELLSILKINYQLVNSLIGIPITSVVCLGVSMLVIYLIRKIPGGQYISG
jgi:surface polysaccharide O-acyltransferase-like enzyme